MTILLLDYYNIIILYYYYYYYYYYCIPQRRNPGEGINMLTLQANTQDLIFVSPWARAIADTSERPYYDCNAAVNDNHTYM